MKTLLITGVSSGLGHSLAQEALNQGWEVWGLSRRMPEDLQERPHFKFLSFDLGAPQWGEALPLWWGSGAPFDLVLLNAGVLGQIQDLAETATEDLREVMEINLWANQRLLALLLGTRGATQVVGISSGAAVNGNRGWGGYSLSKAALNMLLKLYAAEALDCHFSALAPGLIDTAMQDYLCAEPDPERFEAISRLRQARHTPDMPGPDEAARRIWPVLERLKKGPSGQFVDLRKLPPEMT